MFTPSTVGGGTFLAFDGAGAEVDFLTYLGTGLDDNEESGIHVLYCDDREDPDSSARAVLLTGSGQPRVSRDSDDNGVDNLDADTNFECS